MSDQPATIAELKERWLKETDEEGPPALRMRSERHSRELESGPERLLRELRDELQIYTAADVGYTRACRDAAAKLTAILGDRP